MKIAFLFVLLVFPALVQAGWSGELNLLSDYRFNGVSFNSRSPALQGSVTYQHDSGIYLGSWASNVKFASGDPAKVEWDFFAGYYRDINEAVGVDAGYAMYTYHGDSGASDYNFDEYYLGLYLYADTTLYWYHAPDYFGVGTSHNIVKITHNMAVGEYTFSASAANSRSSDANKWAWTESGKEYQYAEVSAARDWHGFNIRAALMGTTIEDGSQEKNAEPTILVSIGKGW